MELALFPDFIWSWTYPVLAWLIRLGSLVVIPFRRDPKAAKGWLILIFFAPFWGLAAFLVLGRIVVSEQRRKDIREFLAKANQFLFEHRSVPEVRALPQTTSELRLEYLYRLGPFPPVTGNSVEILPHYLENLDRLERAIDRARHHVHLLFYIFFHDPATAGIRRALREAAARGVEVRILVDAYGSGRDFRALRREMAGAGIRVHRINPLFPKRGRMGRFDLRGHEKILVVDGVEAYTGSQNLVHFISEKGVRYEDVLVRVQGPAVWHVQSLFLAEWFAQTGEIRLHEVYFPQTAGGGDRPVFIVPSGPVYDSQLHHRLLVEMIYAARERIGITTPYFIPDAVFLHALESAVLRGVAVHLIVPQVTDNGIVDFAQRSYFEELLEKGIHIHHYRERFLHSKFMTIDRDLGFIGTTNIDIRSFELNSEVGVLVVHPESNADLRRLEERQMRLADRLHLDSWRRRSRWSQFLENITRLFSSLL